MYLSIQSPVADHAPTTPAARPPVARVVVVLGLVSLLTDVSSESVAAVLPLYVTAALGLSAAAYGVVDGLYQGVSALVRIGAGWAADTTGRPKWVALLGYGTSVLARVALLFVTGLGAIAAVVSADRIGKGLRTAPRDAMIAAATPAAGLGRAFGVHRALDAVGAALGPLVAAVILWWIPDGYLTVFVVSLGFAILGVVVLGLFVTEPARPAAPPLPASRRLRLLADHRLRRLILVTAALGVATVGDGFLYLALLGRGDVATYWFPLMYVATNVVFLALAVPAGRLSDRVGRARVLLGGHAALLGAYVCAAAPGSGATVTLAALVLLGAFYAATDGATAALASSLVDPAVRASAIAGAQTAVALSRLVSSVGFGLLWFAVGPRAALLLAGAALAATAALVSATVLRLDRPVPAAA